MTGSTFDPAKLDPTLFAGAQPIRYIYVSPTGSDKGDGTAASPYATIQKAVNAATPGTAVMP